MKDQFSLCSVINVKEWEKNKKTLNKSDDGRQPRKNNNKVYN